MLRSSPAIGVKKWAYTPMTAAATRGTVPGMLNPVAAVDRQTAAFHSMAEAVAIALLILIAVATALLLVTSARGATANDAWTDARQAPLAASEGPRRATVVLLVDGRASLDDGEAHRFARQVGVRGVFEVVVAPVRSREVELALRAMLLSERICPPGACDPVLILDLR